jgi:hypothetical protein
MALQHQVYTASVAGQAVTLTPKTGSESKPTHLGASTIVFNTVANPAPTEFFDNGSEYLVTLEKLTKS